MTISSEQLYLLMQVLKDSLEIKMGYDWTFEMKLEKRKTFYEELIKQAITTDRVNINGCE